MNTDQIGEAQKKASRRDVGTNQQLTPRRPQRPLKRLLKVQHHSPQHHLGCVPIEAQPIYAPFEFIGGGGFVEPRQSGFNTRAISQFFTFHVPRLSFVTHMTDVTRFLVNPMCVRARYGRLEKVEQYRIGVPPSLLLPKIRLDGNLCHSPARGRPPYRGDKMEARATTIRNNHTREN